MKPDRKYFIPILLIPFLGMLYVLLLGPFLWLGDKGLIPDVLWYAYYPVFVLWGRGFQAIDEWYFEAYLMWWTDWLPYRFLIDHDV